MPSVELALVRRSSSLRAAQRARATLTSAFGLAAVAVAALQHRQASAH